MNSLDYRDPLERMLREALHADAERAPQLPMEWLAPTTSSFPDAWVDEPLVLVDAGDEQPVGQRRRPQWLLVAAAAVVLVIGVAAFALASTNNKHQPPAPVATDSVAPATTVATKTVLFVVHAGANDVPLAFTAPEDWRMCCTSIQSPDPGTGPGAKVSFGSVSNIFSDGWAKTPLDPPVGPTVDDLVTAWANMPELAATTPVDVKVGPYDAKQIEFTVPDYPADRDDPMNCNGYQCSFGLSYGPDGPAYVQPNEHFQMLVLDVRGTRLVIAVSKDPNISPQDQAALEELLASIRFGFQNAEGLPSNEK